MSKIYKQLVIYFIFFSLALLIFTPISLFDFLGSVENRINTFVEYFYPIGNIYLTILELITLPILIFSIIVGLSHLIKTKTLKITLFPYFKITIIFVLIFFFIVLIFSYIGNYYFKTFEINQNKLYSIIKDDNFFEHNVEIQKNKIEKKGTKNNKKINPIISESVENRFIFNQKKYTISDGIIKYVSQIIPKNIFSSLISKFFIPIFLFFIFLIYGLSKKQQTSNIIIILSKKGLLTTQRLFSWSVYILPIAFLSILANYLYLYSSNYDNNKEVFQITQNFILYFISVGFIFGLILFITTSIIWRHHFIKLLNLYLDTLFLSFYPQKNLIILPRLLSYFSQFSHRNYRLMGLILPFDFTLFNYGQFFYSIFIIIFAINFYDIEFKMTQVALIFLSALKINFLPNRFSSFQHTIITSVLLNSFGIPNNILINLIIPIHFIVNPICFFIQVATVLIKNVILIQILNKKRISLQKKEVTTITLTQKKKKIPNIELKWILNFIILLIILYGFIISFIFYKGNQKSLNIILNQSLESYKGIITHIFQSISSEIQQKFHFIVKKSKELLIINNKHVINSNSQLIKFLYENILIKDSISDYISISYPNGQSHFLMNLSDESLKLLKADITKKIFDIKKYEIKNSIRKHKNIIYFKQKFNPNKDFIFKQVLKNPFKSFWTNVHWSNFDSQFNIIYCFPITLENGSLKAVIKVGIRLNNISVLLIKKLPKEFKAFIFNSYNQLLASSFDQPIWKKKPSELIEKDNKKILIKVSDYYIKSVRRAYSYYSNTKIDFNKINLLKDKSQKGKYLTFIDTLKIQPNIFWHIGVISSEHSKINFQLVENDNTILVILLSLLILILIILFIRFIFDKMKNSLNQLSLEMNKIQKLKFSKVLSNDYFFKIKEVHNIDKSFFNMKKTLKILQRYIPSALISQLIELKSSDTKIGGVKRTLTMFFSDIANFTNISEHIPIENLLKNLAIYFTHGHNIISKHSGTIDKYIGDAIMAFWGAPKKIENPALKCCLAAIECQQAFQLISDFKVLSTPFNTRIGINTGEVIVGNIGSLKRLNYTVIGDNVNLTSRLESLNKIYDTSIIMSESTKLEVQDFIEYRLLDKVAVKGKEIGTNIYQILGVKNKITLLKDSEKLTEKEINQFLTLFSDGVKYYFEQNFPKALTQFIQAREIYHIDKASQILENRCYQYIKNPPDKSWTGVFTLSKK